MTCLYSKVESFPCLVIGKLTRKPSEILREYRKLDDTITMRLNRANAAMRDQERTQDGLGGENVQNQACAYIWRELVGQSIPTNLPRPYPLLDLLHCRRKLEAQDTISGVLCECC